MQALDATDNLFLHDFGVCDRYANGLQAAARVRCPVDFILGAHDQMTAPKAAVEIGKAVERAHHDAPRWAFPDAGSTRCGVECLARRARPGTLSLSRP
jgi:pimeloyl-ACP methyl ester carboxylesterase